IFSVAILLSRLASFDVKAIDLLVLFPLLILIFAVGNNDTYLRQWSRGHGLRFAAFEPVALTAAGSGLWPSCLAGPLAATPHAWCAARSAGWGEASAAAKSAKAAAKAAGNTGFAGTITCSLKRVCTGIRIQRPTGLFRGAFFCLLVLVLRFEN